MSSLIALLLLFVSVSEEPVHLYKVTVPGIAADVEHLPQLPTVDGEGPIVVAAEFPEAVERWRPLVAAHFTEVDYALGIIDCESDGDPNATGAAGEASLFQIATVHFWRFAQFSSPNPWNPEQNVIVASQLQREQGWQIWSCA